MMGKRFACHRVYDAHNHYLNQSIVTVGTDGRVVEVVSLNQESPATEWIGGIIVLSDKAEIPPSVDFRTLTEQMPAGSSPCYAWHISDFDFQNECLTSNSIIRRL